MSEAASTGLAVFFNIAEQFLAVDTPLSITFLFMPLTQHKRRNVERFLAIMAL